MKTASISYFMLLTIEQIYMPENFKKSSFHATGDTIRLQYNDNEFIRGEYLLIIRSLKEELAGFNLGEEHIAKTDNYYYKRRLMRYL